MRSHLTFSVALAGICLAVVPGTIANAGPTSKQTFPEIVRINYLDGDVRVSRGHQGGAPKDADWEKAVANLPIQAGFTLATDEGRAEIEFEDSSIVYLAPHSVLIFNDLLSTGDAPQSDLALLTGTATLQVHPHKRDEIFILRTPTDTLVVQNGQRSDMRVTAYMDAIAITPMVGGFVQITPSLVQAAVPGRTHFYRDGKQVAYSDPESEASLKQWDMWVSNEMASRDKVLAKMLNTTGLKEPVPGLAQLDGQGKFVDCPGYGTCWEPPTPPEPKPKAQNGGDPNNMSSLVQPQDASSGSGTTKPKKTYTNPASNSGAFNYYNAGLYFPCGPDAMYSGLAMQANYNMAMMGAYGYGNGYGYYSSMSPWAWAVCHSGSWIYQQDRYLWVPGGAIQHFPPVHWVRHGDRVGFIPIHPRDVGGRQPVNGTHGIIALTDKQGRSFAHVTVEPGSQLKVLNTAPKEFRKPTDPSLTRTDAPHMEGHLFRPTGNLEDGNRSHPDRTAQSNAHVARGEGLNADGGRQTTGHGAAPGLTIADKGGHGNVVAVPILYDHGSQNFMMSHEVVSGHNVRTVSEPVGSYLARSGQSFGGREGAQVGRPGMAAGSGSGYESGNPGMSTGRGVFPGNSGGNMGGGGFNGGGGLSPSGNVGGGGPGVSTGGGLSGGGGVSTGGGLTAPASPK